MKKLLYGILSILLIVSSVSMFSACKNNENNDKKYSINYIVDGEIYSSTKSLGNEIFEYPVNPSKTGFDFYGWYLDEQFKQPFYGDEFKDTKLTQDISVYAKFSVKSIKVTFVTNCDLIQDDVYFKYNDSFNDDDFYLRRDGYDFMGWYTDDNTFQNRVEHITLTGNINLYAKWSIKKYTISYVLMSGATNSSYNVTSYTIESDYIMIRSPEPPLLYVFKGWYTKPNGQGSRVFGIQEGSTGNITLYAYFVPESEA